MVNDPPAANSSEQAGTNLYMVQKLVTCVKYIVPHLQT